MLTIGIGTTTSALQGNEGTGAIVGAIGGRWHPQGVAGVQEGLTESGGLTRLHLECTSCKMQILLLSPCFHFVAY